MALYIGIKNLIGKGAAWLRSKWTTIVTQLKATFRYREAAGGDNVNLPESNGRAVFKKIYGNTVKFNQLLNWLSISALGRWSGNAAFSFSKSGTKLIATCTTAGVFSYYKPLLLIPTGHKVYSAIDLANSTDVSKFRIRLGRSGSGSSTNMGTITDTMSRFSCIGSIDNSTDTVYTYFILESATNTSIEVGNITQFDNWIIQDLTDIFGSDAEIAAALGISVADITTEVGVAAFEAWLALNVGAQDYYPYDEGSLLSFTGQGVKVTGWNKFHVVNGSGVADVKKGVKYYVAGPFGSLHYSDGTAISVASDRTFTAIKDDTITFGSVSNSIVLNIYTGTAKDGTYEPYHEEVVDLSGAYINVWDEEVTIGNLDPTSGAITSGTRVCSKNYIQVKPQETYYFREPAANNYAIVCYDAQKSIIPGIDPSGFYFVGYNTAFTMPANCYYIRFRMPAGYGNTYKYNLCINVSNADVNGTYYPHALQSAGSVTDEDTATELKKKVFESNLGELTFSYDGNYFRSTVLNVRAVNGNNGISYPYKVKSLSNLTIADDKTIGLGTNQIYIRDTDHDGNDLDNGKATWLQNIPFIYEMQSPIIIPHDTPMQYKVDKYSTEEVIVPASAGGAPTSTALVADIEYQAK